MTELEYKALAAQGYNRIPLIAESFADLETPLSLYLKLARTQGSGANSFLLESVVGGERFGRYSFIGLPASTMLRSTPTGAEVVKNGQVIERFEGNPLDFVDQYRKRFRVAVRPGLPRFCGGLAGYFAYDAVRFIEPRLAGVSKPDPVGVPDILLLLTEELAIIDNIAGKIYLMVYADPSESEAYQKATKRLRDLRVKLRHPVDVPVSSGSYETPTERDFPKEKYLQAVLRAKDYIMAGDMMQVQIGQVLRKQFRDSPLTLYRALRSINPSPYMYLYNFGDFHVVGASPEILVRQEHQPDGDRITIRPLTRDDLRVMSKWPRFQDPLYRLFDWPKRSEASDDLWFHQLMRDKTRVYYAVVNEVHELIGRISLREIDGQKSARLGIGFGPDYVDQGYGTEAL